MELNTYLNCQVQIVLDKGFTYIGKVISIDEDSLTIIDKYNSQITLKESSISFIKDLNGGFNR